MPRHKWQSTETVSDSPYTGCHWSTHPVHCTSVNSYLTYAPPVSTSHLTEGHTKPHCGSRSRDWSINHRSHECGNSPVRVTPDRAVFTLNMGTMLCYVTYPGQVRSCPEWGQCVVLSEFCVLSWMWSVCCPELNQWAVLSDVILSESCMILSRRPFHKGNQLLALILHYTRSLLRNKSYFKDQYRTRQLKTVSNVVPSTPGKLALLGYPRETRTGGSPGRLVCGFRKGQGSTT